MSWTEDRVATLTKLWMQGLSAAQIAGILGGGVTRNAVIGKVHRLKLSGRARPANAATRARPVSRSRRTATSSSASSTSARAKKRTNATAPATIGATALKQEEEALNNIDVAPETKELFIPENERLTLLDLTEDSCKWPIGDPLNPDFHFCGRHSLENKPYCEFHSKRAYHKSDRKKR